VRAVILAGGKGTRLKPYTTLIPKPLVPIGGTHSILEIVIQQLRRDGFDRVTLAVSHLANLIMAYFGDGSRFGIRLDYSLEDQPLSTIGPLTLIDDLPEDFLVMNGDILCDLDFRGFFRRHLDSGSDVSVAACRREVSIDFGVIRCNDAGRLSGFEEKPKLNFDVSMGIYCLNRRVVQTLPRGVAYGFDHLMYDALKGRFTVEVRPFAGFWLDIGRPDDYQYADDHFSTLKEKLRLPL
jgi:NDP-mannose synthase